MDSAAIPVDQDVNRRWSGPRTTESLAGSVTRAALRGITWGGAARLWMRYISEDPEFTVSGTSFIVAIPTIISLAGVLAVRSVKWRPILRRPARSAAAFSTILLGGAAGILMMPTLLLGGIIWAHKKILPKFLILIIAALACLPIVAVVQEIPRHRMLLAFPAYLLLLSTFIPVYARIYNPSYDLPGKGSAS